MSELGLLIEATAWQKNASTLGTNVGSLAGRPSILQCHNLMSESEFWWRFQAPVFCALYFYKPLSSTTFQKSLQAQRSLVASPSTP